MKVTVDIYASRTDGFRASQFACHTNVTQC